MRAHRERQNFFRKQNEAENQDCIRFFGLKTGAQVTAVFLDGDRVQQITDIAIFETKVIPGSGGVISHVTLQGKRHRLGTTHILLPTEVFNSLPSGMPPKTFTPFRKGH